MRADSGAPRIVVLTVFYVPHPLVLTGLYVPHSSPDCLMCATFDRDGGRGGEDQGLAVDEGRLGRAEDLAQHLLSVRALRAGLALHTMYEPS